MIESTKRPGDAGEGPRRSGCEIVPSAEAECLANSPAPRERPFMPFQNAKSRTTRRAKGLAVPGLIDLGITGVWVEDSATSKSGRRCGVTLADPIPAMRGNLHRIPHTISMPWPEWHIESLEPTGVLTLAIVEAAVAKIWDGEAVPFDGDGTYIHNEKLICPR